MGHTSSVMDTSAHSMTSAHSISSATSQSRVIQGEQLFRKPFIWYWSEIFFLIITLFHPLIYHYIAVTVTPDTKDPLNPNPFGNDDEDCDSESDDNDKSDEDSDENSDNGDSLTKNKVENDARSSLEHRKTTPAKISQNVEENSSVKLKNALRSMLGWKDIFEEKIGVSFYHLDKSREA
jgi:hypothetical protein